MKKIMSFLLLVSFVGMIAGCSSNEETKTEDASATVGDIKMGRVNYAAHGDKSFAVAVVALNGEKIVGASIDEFQFLDSSKKGVVPVPSSDGAFGENYVTANMPLASKLDSSEYYSAHMAEAGSATNTVEENYQAIEAYVTGKTISELETALSENTPENMVDVVSGATLVDTYGYVKAFLEAANAAE